MRDTLGARTASTALRVSDGLVLEAMSLAAAGGTPDEVGHGLLAALTRQVGVRAGAVVLGARGRRGPTVIASVGYPCETFAPGEVLPADAGLPVTRAACTGRTVVSGSGPSWVAVPVTPGGALLLSLTGAPPSRADLGRLETLGRLVGPALARAQHRANQGDELAVLEHLLSPEPPGPALPGLQAAVRQRPYASAPYASAPYASALGASALGGDVVLLLSPPGADVCWLLVADVSGRGAGASVAGLRVRAAAAALAPHCSGPAQLLARLAPALVCGEEGFVTALALRLTRGGAVIASAGHPGPLLRVEGRVLQPAVLPAPPLGIGDPIEPPETLLALPRGALLVAHTDGLLDRRPEVDLVPLLATLPADASAEQAADALLAACEATGPTEDDASLVVLRREDAG